MHLVIVGLLFILIALVRITMFRKPKTEVAIFLSGLSVFLGIVFLTVGTRDLSLGLPRNQSSAGESNIYKVECAFRQETNDMAILQQMVISPKTFERIPIDGELRLWKLTGKLPVQDGEYIIAVKENDKVVFRRHPLTTQEKARAEKN